MKKGDIILAVVIVNVLAVAQVFRGAGVRAAGSMAVITVDGREVKKIDLPAVDTPYSFRLQHDEDRWDVVEVERGRIRVAAVSCPRQIAVHQNWISTSAQVIVCLPNKLLITIENNKSEDYASDIDGLVS